MKNEPLFFEFVYKYLEDYLRKACSRSDHTIESYRNGLIVFKNFITDEKKISIKKFRLKSCDRELILQYIEYLEKLERAPSTINHHISVIKNYLEYIGNTDITYISIYSSISRIPQKKIPKKIKPVLDDEMLKLLFSLPKQNDKGIRNRTILILLYDTAIRVEELINIKVCDLFINSKAPYILIHGKGNKERIVGVSMKAKAHLKLYLSRFHKDQKSEYLFYTTIKGISDKLSESTVETFIQKYADIARKENPNIPKHVYPHMFRRTKATHLYQDGIPLEMVSSLLGHSSTETTKIYAKPSLEQIRAIIENDSDKETEPEWDEDDEIAKLFGLR